MTVNHLLLLAPWLIFAVGLAAVCGRLLALRSSARRNRRGGR